MVRSSPLHQQGPADETARRSAIIVAVVAVILIAASLLPRPKEQGATAQAAPAPLHPSPVIVVVTATPGLPTMGRAPGAQLAAATAAPPTATASPEPTPEGAPIVAGGQIDAPPPTEAKIWISPDSYMLPGSQIVYTVDSSGQVVDQRLPGSEAWMRNAPTEAPTAAAPPAPRGTSNYCPRCGWHK